MKENPFSLDFGAEPNLYIPRLEENRKIVGTFKANVPSTHIFILIGARGTGKTVLMTSVSHELQKEKEWIHIDLGTESNMLNLLAANLYEKTRKQLPKVTLGVSVKGVSVSLEKEQKYADIQTDLDSMLRTLDKHKMKVLITVDEVINSQSVREFTTYFQHCIREKLPVFVIMTGLYKNIRALQNNRSQTFLRRAPKINLGSLNLFRISKEYENVFNISTEAAYAMALHTHGYSYGFQILGYIIFESGKTEPDEDVLFEYKMNLAECSYDKIWEELSDAERKVVIAIAKSRNDASIKEIRESMDIDSNNFSTYKDTLVKSGILADDAAYGKIEFNLPYFREYVEKNNDL